MSSQIIKKQLERLDKEPLLSLTLKLSIPVMLSLLISSLYNILDSIFVAHYSSDALVALTIAYPIQTFIFALSLGTGTGVNSYISRKNGENNFEEAKNAACHAIFIGVIINIIFAIFILFFLDAFLSLYNISQTVYSMSKTYISIIPLASFGYIFELILGKIIQSLGNTIVPMISSFTGAITNLFLDPLLIFGYLGFPRLGATGAAIATIIGQIMATTVCFYYLFVKSKYISLKFRGFRFNVSTVMSIYAVGLPVMIMQSITASLGVFLNKLLNSFSPDAVSILGIYLKIYSFVSMPVLGIGQGIMPILGFNYGSRNRRRLEECLKLSLKLSFSILLIISILLYNFPSHVIGLFDPTTNMLNIGIPAFKIISFGFIFTSIAIILSIFFQSIGKGKYSLTASIFRQVFTIIPFSYILSKLIGINGIWLSIPISEFVACLTTTILFVRVYRKEISCFDNE